MTHLFHVSLVHSHVPAREPSDVCDGPGHASVRSYWLKGAVCKPPSKAAGTTVNETFPTSPNIAVALPRMPGVFEDANGLSNCQHSIVAALFAAPVAVMFKRRVCTALAPRPRMSSICILMGLCSVV